MSEQTHVVLGVTGSIAAYKAAELVRMVTGKGWSVSVVMTEAATWFVGSLTFHTLSGRPVVTGKFDDLSEEPLPHITLGANADVMVVAPCTANVLAKIATGLADDALTATILASTAPVIVAPAMNTQMWKNAATQANVETLKARGITVLEVGTGDLACGVGEGRLCELDVIMRAVEEKLS